MKMYKRKGVIQAECDSSETHSTSNIVHCLGNLTQTGRLPPISPTCSWSRPMVYPDRGSDPRNPKRIIHGTPIEQARAINSPVASSEEKEVKIMTHGSIQVKNFRNLVVQPEDVNEFRGHFSAFDHEVKPVMNHRPPFTARTNPTVTHINLVILNCRLSKAF